MTTHHTSEESQETLSADEIAELDRRWAAIEAGEATISNNVVLRWLHTWGSPEFKPWSGGPDLEEDLQRRPSQ
jgi:hypothetical protein